MGQGDNRDIVWDEFVVDQLAHKIKIRLGGRWKPNLNFFEADFDQQFKKAQFTFNTHRFDERLIAITQVGAHPDRWVSDLFSRPGAL